MTPALHALRRRLNAAAYDQVNEELARLDLENEALRAGIEELRQRLAWAEDCAEHWREDAFSALNEQAEATGRAIGLTQAGHLMLLTAEMPQ
ncbi:hypothetical protein GY14_30275 [Delftia tsuruhatensis]|nr:hypothetical protein GY14_30275 [Delftia tsuruhatensis]